MTVLPWSPTPEGRESETVFVRPLTETQSVTEQLSTPLTHRLIASPVGLLFQSRLFERVKVATVDQMSVAEERPVRSNGQSIPGRVRRTRF